MKLLLVAGVLGLAALGAWVLWQFIKLASYRAWVAP